VDTQEPTPPPQKIVEYGKEQGKVEEIRVGKKLRLISCSFDHYEGFFNKYGDRMAAQIARPEVSAVIVEYFPQEIETLKDNSLAIRMTNYNDIDSFFTGVTDLARQNGKEVVVMDPAHNADFGFFREALLALNGAGIVITLATWGDFIRSKNRMSRRHFLRNTVSLGAGMGLTLIQSGADEVIKIKEESDENPPDSFFSEDNFRRSIIARGIKQLAERLDSDPNAPETTMLLIYPPVHWKGIKRFLQDDEALNGMFATDQVFKIFGKAAEESFFSIRFYQPGGSQWEKVGTMQIN
jgi:hypothetical protein